MSLEQSNDPTQILSDLISSDQGHKAANFIEGLEVGELVRAVAALSEEHREHLLDLLKPQEAAELIEHMPEPQAVDALEGLDPGVAARILEELPSNEKADLIGELEGPEAEAILAEFTPEDAFEIRKLVAYDDDVAGGLMITELLSFQIGSSVGEVIEDIRENSERYRSFDIQYAYVVDKFGALVGVLRLRDLLLSPRKSIIDSLMIRSPISVPDHTTLQELEDQFDEHRFYGIPVVDEKQRLLGVVRRSAVEEALAERSEEDYRKAQGVVGGEELRSMPLFLRSKRRLSWLSVNIFLNIIAASVIAYFEDTLSQVIALAVFLPIISDMSGCSGNQAVAVSMRELSLGVARPADLIRVLKKEFGVGIFNGFFLGALLGGVAALWTGKAAMGLVVGGALWINTLVAVMIGGGIPLFLKKIGRDPALSSGPILTTVTDMLGFFLALSFATLLLHYLV